MHISEIWIYPIKACRGISVSSAAVEPRGLRGDRRWMIADEGGKFVSQRTETSLALLDTAIAGDRIELSKAGDNQPPLSIPLDVADYEGDPAFDQEPVDLEVWGTACQGIVHREGSAWISSYLNKPLRLVYMPDDFIRPVNPARGQPGDIVSYADGYPVLMAGQASLDDLNRRLAESAHPPLTMQRFRPNLICAGGEPFDEDQLGEFEVRPATETADESNVAFEMVKLCDRCSVTTVDPETAIRGKEPLRTLATYRRWDGEVWFGVNLIPRNLGVISTYDQLVTPKT